MKQEKNTDVKKNNGGFAAGGFKAAVFDYDGTVLDSMPMWTSVPSRFAEKLGAEPDPELNRQIKTMSLEESARTFREMGAAGTDEEIVDQIMDMVMDSYRLHLQMKPGVMELLEDLKSHGIRMCIASQTPSRMIAAANERLGIDSYFEGIYSCGEWNTHKRDPDIFLIAADSLEAGPSETLVFEDTLYAVRSAEQAGFSVVGIYDENSADDREQIEERSLLYLKRIQDWPGIESLQEGRQ